MKIEFAIINTKKIKKSRKNIKNRNKKNKITIKYY